MVIHTEVQKSRNKILDTSPESKQKMVTSIAAIGMNKNFYKKLKNKVVLSQKQSCSKDILVLLISFVLPAWNSGRSNTIQIRSFKIFSRGWPNIVFALFGWKWKCRKKSSHITICIRTEARCDKLPGEKLTPFPRFFAMFSLKNFVLADTNLVINLGDPDIYYNILKILSPLI